MPQQFQTTDALVLWVGVGEMLSYVAKCGGTKEGIADGVQQDVGIAMAHQAVGVRHKHTTQPKGQPFGKLVYVVSCSYPHHLFCVYLFSGIISIAKPMRMVCANGLVDILVVGTR